MTTPRDATRLIKAVRTLLKQIEAQSNDGLVYPAIADIKKALQEYDSGTLSLNEALTQCLEVAKVGGTDGARPLGFKGIVMAWEKDYLEWNIHQVDADVEPHDDTILVGGWEVLPHATILREWPIKCR